MKQLSRRKQRDKEVRCKPGSHHSEAPKAKDVFDDSSDAHSDVLEVTDTENEDSFVSPPETFSSDKRLSKISEPTKREFRIAKHWPDEATSRKRESLGDLNSLPRPHDESNAVNPRPITGRLARAQHRSNPRTNTSARRDIKNPIQRSVSDPSLAYDEQPAPSAQLSSGPRFQSHMAAKPGGSGRELLKKRSSDVFLDNTNRAYGDKKRIRAVLPHR